MSPPKPKLVNTNFSSLSSKRKAISNESILVTSSSLEKGWKELLVEYQKEAEEYAKELYELRKDSRKRREEIVKSQGFHVRRSLRPESRTGSDSSFASSSPTHAPLPSSVLSDNKSVTFSEIKQGSNESPKSEDRSNANTPTLLQLLSATNESNIHSEDKPFPEESDTDFLDNIEGTNLSSNLKSLIDIPQAEEEKVQNNADDIQNKPLINKEERSKEYTQKIAKTEKREEKSEKKQDITIVQEKVEEPYHAPPNAIPLDRVDKTISTSKAIVIEESLGSNEGDFLNLETGENNEVPLQNNNKMSTIKAADEPKEPEKPKAKFDNDNDLFNEKLLKASERTSALIQDFKNKQDEPVENEKPSVSNEVQNMIHQLNKGNQNLKDEINLIKLLKMQEEEIYNQVVINEDDEIELHDDVFELAMSEPLESVRPASFPKTEKKKASDSIELSFTDLFSIVSKQQEEEPLDLQQLKPNISKDNKMSFSMSHAATGSHDKNTVNLPSNLIKGIEQETKQLIEKINQLKLEVKEKKEEYEQMSSRYRNENEILKEEVTQTKQQLHDVTHERDKYYLILEDYSRQYTVIKPGEEALHPIEFSTFINSIVQERESLKYEKNALEIENIDTKQANETLEKRLNDLALKSKKQDKKIQELEKNILSMKGKHKTEKQSLLSQVDSLKHELNKKHHEIGSIKHAKSTLETTLKRIEESYSSLFT